MIYVEDSGCLTWERPANPGDADAGEIAAEAAGILRDARCRHGPPPAAGPGGSASPSGHRELTGTSQQQLVFLNTHWGRNYVFSVPQTAGGQWTATARFGGHEQIQRQSAGDLLAEVRRHYHRNKQGSYHRNKQGSRS